MIDASSLVSFHIVMPGLVPGIHVHPSVPTDVDGRDKPGHDVVRACTNKQHRVAGGTAT
ncbi:hypothetical protein [Bradyrhizobium sp. HKCCYLRH3061]|uniref:hypothetical protein n=1 Tax=Bradyrhizobium sp. HKCCYLRH3061 TaxID=3420734 RepID=UPI003EBAFA5C